MPACTLFGHRNIPNNLYASVYSLINMLITENGVDTFYVGNNGEYDRLVRRVLKDIRTVHPNIKYYVVLAYPPKKDAEDYSDSIYPEGIELAPKKSAIVWRNKWMISKSDYVIGYVEHPFGGAYAFLEMARRQKKVIFNIAQ